MCAPEKRCGVTELEILSPFFGVLESKAKGKCSLSMPARVLKREKMEREKNATENNVLTHLMIY